MTWVRGFLRHNGIALLALFVALSGSAYAAKKIGTKNIKNRAVTANKLAPNSVDSTKLAPDSVDSTKVRDGSIGPQDISVPVGPPGAREGKIVTVCQRTTPVAVTSTGSFGTLPGFTGCAWGQPAGALDYFFARLKATRPVACADPGEELHVRVDINALNTVAISDTVISGAATGKTFTLAPNDDFAWLTPNWFTAATNTPPWTLIPRAYDNCSSNWTIDRFEIVVVRAAA